MIESVTLIDWQGELVLCQERAWQMLYQNEQNWYLWIDQDKHFMRCVRLYIFPLLESLGFYQFSIMILWLFFYYSQSLHNVTGMFIMLRQCFTPKFNAYQMVFFMVFIYEVHEIEAFAYAMRINNFLHSCFTITIREKISSKLIMESIFFREGISIY